LPDRHLKNPASAGDHLQIDLRGKLHIFSVNAQDGLAPGNVRPVNQHVPVKPSRAQQRRVQRLRPVGGRQDHHTAAVIKAVHLHQQLIQGLFALIVPAGDAGISHLADGIKLVDEYDAGGLGPRLTEKIAHSGRPHPHKELHEVGTADGKEGHA